MTVITVPALASWLNITDGEDDVNLISAVAASNRAVRRWCGRTFEVTTTSSASARTFTPKSWKICRTDDFWTTEGLIVKVDSGDDGTYETTLSSTTDFFPEIPTGQERALGFPYRKLVSTGWSFPTCNLRPSVQVTAAWGWQSIPEDVVLGGLIKGARLFKRRQSPEGFAGGFQDFAARISRSEDPDVIDLLADYRTEEVQLYVG